MGWPGTGRAQATSLLSAVDLAGGWEDSVHWRALQHHLGPPRQPLCPGVELVHFLDRHRAALEGDRGPAGSACRQGYRLRPRSMAVCPTPSPPLSYVHVDTHKPHVHCHSHS